jgi:L-alanine-DL-glutamate epimerase-like enolase superfamily enzyme
MADDETIESTASERVSLPLAESFTISRGTTETAQATVVRIRDQAGRVGVGSASPSTYYDETPDSVEGVLPELLDEVESVGDPHEQQVIAGRLAERAPDEAAARAAVSIAVHDLAARQREEPLYRRWGLDPERAPRTSYTVSIDAPDEMRERARDAVDAGYSVLKVKLGTDTDRKRLEAVREGAPTARIRVDANCAWDPEVAIANTEWLADLDVEFLEQPVPAADVTGLREVAVRGAVPIAADEACVTAADVPRVADAVDIVVVKLMKCGGLRPAHRQILTAQSHGLEVMLGCMIESDASIAGSCQLAPLVEYADLDGSLLLGSDPYEGVPMPEGRIDLAAIERGTGVRERQH